MADEQPGTGVGESRSDLLTAEEVKEVDLAFTRSDYKPPKGKAMKSKKKVVDFGSGEVEAMPNDFIPAKTIGGIEDIPIGKTVPSVYLPDINIDAKDEYKCCGKVFKNKRAFNMHRRISKECPNKREEI